VARCDAHLEGGHSFAENSDIRRQTDGATGGEPPTSWLDPTPPLVLSRRRTHTNRAIPMSFRPGDMIGDHEVLDVIGAGGMGQVYRVLHAITGRIEAMKIVLPDLENEPEAAQRFMQHIRSPGAKV
jgi:serine/threonine protein kinase